MGASGDCTHEKWGGGLRHVRPENGEGQNLVAKGWKICNLLPLFVFMVPALLPLLKTKKILILKWSYNYSLVSILQYDQYNVKYSNQHSMDQWETDCSQTGQSLVVSAHAAFGLANYVDHFNRE